MNRACDMKGTKIRAKVRFLRMTFPKSKHAPGDFAISTFAIKEMIEGELPAELSTDIGGIAFDPEIVVKGRMPKMLLGVDYIMQGTLNIDKKYGPQYDLDMIRLDYDMKNGEDQRKFFSYFLTERQVELLFSEGNNPVKWLEEKDIQSLCSIKGIGPVTAQRMCDRYEECKDNSRAYIELQGLGMTKAAIDKIVKKYGSPDLAVDKIKDNPYTLIRDVKGYGWNKADEIAQANGFTRDCKERTVAYIQYVLEAEAEDNGNSWVKVDDMLRTVKDMCCPEDLTKVADWIQNSLYVWVKEMMGGEQEFQSFAKMNKFERSKAPVPTLYYDRVERRVGLMSIRLLEHDIAANLKRLKEAPAPFAFTDEEIREAVEKAETEQGFQYDPEQRRAIDLILNSNVSILTGLAGCGKSSMLNAVTKVLRGRGMSVEQCALSGRASSKLSEVTKVEGKTIHRLLAYDPDDGGFHFNSSRPLTADVVILDETSMVGGDLFLSLIEAIPTGSKFIMVGDHHQLEAIGLANVFKDCLTAAGYIPASILSTIHRQASKSGIITQSIRATNGEKMVDGAFCGEEIRGELKDFKLVCSIDPTFTQSNIISEYRKLLAAGIKPDDIQIIVPQRLRGNISCFALNERIQAIVNPAFSPSNRTVHFEENGMRYDVTFKVGDKVIVTKNNYKTMKPNGTKVSIFNGNVGYIKRITDEEMLVELTEQGEVLIAREDWFNISLAYAITCHKKQGDQVPYAIVGLDSSAYAMYSKEWVYTAITRASRYCVFVTQPNALNKAVRVSRVKTKKTWLKEFLADYAREEEGNAGA